MAFINTTTADQACGDVAVMYRDLQGKGSYLPNYARIFCHRPKLMTAWAALQKELKHELSDKAYALVCLSAARAAGSSYCSLAFAIRLLQHYYSPAQLKALLEKSADSPLDNAERAMCALAERVARDPAGITEHDIRALREHGFSDETIFDVVAAAAARCFFSKIPDALGAQPDRAYLALPRALRDLLVVGRKIEGGDAPAEHPAATDRDRENHKATTEG